MFHKDVLLFLIKESFNTADTFIRNVLSGTSNDKEYSHALTSNTHLQILCVFHHKVLWKTFQCTDTDDDYVQTFIEYIEYIFMETKGLLNTIQSLMQNKKFSLSKLQQLTKTLSESPIQLLIPSIISFLSSPNMMRITWRIFNGGSPEDKEWRTCSIHLNDLVLILDQFIAFCGIDTCNLSLISNHAKNRSNSYPPMVLNSEHPWKCMQNKWYVIQDANLSSLYLTFHPNSSTPNTDGELKIGLQQHHVASIPRTALDIHLRGLFGAWPILPIEIPTDRLYLRWQKTETPSFKPYVDLLHDYFNKEITNHASMWGFRMESYGLVRSSRTIYKQSDPTIFKFGFKPNRLPFLVDIQTEVISLSKSLGFNYMLTPHAHPRGYRRNKAIPTQLFSSTIFAAGWDGKTLRITEKVQVPRTQTDSDKDTNGDEDKEKEEVKETEDTVKIYDVDYDDPSKTVAQGLYRDPNTSPSNARALSLWSSVSQNLMIPKSLEKIITELRLPVLSALIRHLPLEQQSLFVEQNTDTSDEGMEIIKQVFMIGNNILRWVLDNLMSEKKAFEKIETVYTLAVREKDLQKRVTEITDEKLRLVKETEEEQPEKDEEEKEQTHEQKQDMDEKEETKEDNTKEENPQQTKLNNEMVQILEEMENVEADLMSEIETICKTMQSFCHKYFTVYCEGNGVRLGFSRSSLDVNEISQHLNGWITKCLESLLDHKPDLDVCLNHFNRAFKNRIQIVLQLKWNTNLTLKHLQQFLCNDYYFCYSDNPVLEIHMMMTQRQKGTKHRVEAIQHLLQLMECAEQCNATYPLALAVHVPPAPLKRWCYTNGLEGLPIEDIKDLKLIFAKWLSKMLSIGNDLHQFTTQKVNKQQSHRQKFIKWRSPKKSNKAKDKKEEKKDPEPEAKPEVQKKKVIPKSPRLSNQQLVSMSTEHFLDIFQIVLSSISCAQFNKNDMNLLFETKAMQTLFDWESKMCRCEYPYPTPLLHKSDFMWNEILKVLHSCSEGVFQWIESDAMHEKDDKQKQIALDLSSNILSQILNRLHTELHFICSINEDSLNEEMAAVEELNKRKMKPSEVKQWTYKRILTSHQCMLKYFQLLHRLSTFKTAYHSLTAPDNTIYYSYLTLLFGILCNHQCLQHDHHRIYSLCIQKLCDLLPTLDLDSFNQIIHESKDNVLLSFDDDQSFVTFILKSIGSYLYFDKPALDQMSLTRTLSILSESDKVSGYSDANRHGTYSLILKIPSEINTNSFIKYLVPKYLNDEFQSMINSLTNVPTVAKKKPKNASPDKSQSDVAILQSFVDEEPDSNYDNNDDDDDYNEDDEDYDENEEEEDDDEEEEEEEDAHDDYDEEHEPPRGFDAILAFEEFMTSAVSVSKLKANIIDIKSIFNAKNRYKFEDEEEDETKIWLKKVNDSLKDENSAILFTGKLKHCYSLASFLANSGAIVYIEKSRNIADRNENLLPMNHSPANEVIPLQSQLMWNYYFMNGLFKSLIVSPSWFDVINKCLNQISREFVDLFDEMDVTKDTDWMNNDWSNNLVAQLSSNAQNDKRLMIWLGMLLSLNNNYYGQNSNIYKYLNRNHDHRSLFVGARVRVTCLNKLKFEGLITYIDTKSREITILLDNFYLEGRSGNPLKPFEVIRLAEQNEIEIIDFLSDKDVIAKHTEVISSISLRIIQQWPDLLQKLRMVLKTWSKMNAMLAAIQQQNMQSMNAKTTKQDTEPLSPQPEAKEDTGPHTPKQIKPDEPSIAAISPPPPQPSNADTVSPQTNASEPNPVSDASKIASALDVDASEIAMLAMAFEEDDGFDLAELQKAMALSMSVDPDAADDNQENKQNDPVPEEESNDQDNGNEIKDADEEQPQEEPQPEPQMEAQSTDNDTPEETQTEKETEQEEVEKEEEKEDEKQQSPSTQFIETCNRLQEERQQYQILFHLIQGQMLNIVHNTLLFCSDEANTKDKNTLLQNSTPILKSFADRFISMANTQAASSSNWQDQYEDSMTIYHDLMTHNYLFNEFNRHIATIMENDALKDEEDEEDDKKENTFSYKRLTSEQMATVPYQPRYDEEEKMMIGMDGNLLQFPTKWNLRFLQHFIIHPQSLQIEYKEKQGKSLVVTTNNKVPFVHDYYFEIKVIKLEPNMKDAALSGEKDGNLSIGIRSNWVDYFVSNTGWKWSAKRRFVQFDTENASNVLNTEAPKVPLFTFESSVAFINDNEEENGDGDKQSKPDIIESMCTKFRIGDYVDIYDDSDFIAIWKSGKISNIKAASKTIVVELLANKQSKEFVLSTKNVFKKIAPFCSKCDSASPPIPDRDFNQATDFGLMRFGVGDVIGCGINQLDGEIYFTQNGKRFWGNKPTFDGVPLFDFWPAIEIRNANVQIEANFGQQAFEYVEFEEIAWNEKDGATESKWKDRVVQYEAQLSCATKQRLAVKRNTQELRSMAYARRLDIAESISAGGLLVGINQRQLLRGIEFNQDDPNRVVDWALNQENYESAFAELGPSKSEREIESEEAEIGKQKERVARLESNRMMMKKKKIKHEEETEEKKKKKEVNVVRRIPRPDYLVISSDCLSSQKIGSFEHYDAYYDGVELDYGFNVFCGAQNMNNMLPIYYTQTVSDPVAEKWLCKVESRLTIHGMDRFTMISILNRLRNNPHDTVALMQAREIDPGLEKCPIQRSESAAATGCQSPMSPSKHLQRSVKEVNVTPELLKFGVCVHVKADNPSRVAMIRAKIWLDELERVRNSIGRVIYVDVDTKPKLALVLFENVRLGKEERWWLPLDVLQIVILDYNSSTLSSPVVLGKSFLHHMNRTSSSIAKICLELLYNLDPAQIVNDLSVPFNSIQNYQYYASLLCNPLFSHCTTNNHCSHYAQHALRNVARQDECEILNEMIDESLQQLNQFNVHLNPTQNALSIRQNAFDYKVSIGCDILMQVMTDATRKTKSDDALTIYGDMGCTHILYRAKLHEVKTKTFCKSQVWISVTGETELTLALSSIPRLMNLFLCPQIRDEWHWDASLIHALVAGYFKCDNIAIVIASQWMLSISHVLKNANKELIREELSKNSELAKKMTQCCAKLQQRLRFYYSADIEAHPDHRLHSVLLKHVFSARYFAQDLFEIEDDEEANDDWYIKAVNTIKIAQYFCENDAFPLEFVSSLCCDYLFEEKKEETEKDDDDDDNEEEKADEKDLKDTLLPEILETPHKPHSTEKLKWLQSGWNRRRDMLLLNTMARYNMSLQFSRIYGAIGSSSKHTSLSSLSQNEDDNDHEENDVEQIPSEYQSMMDKILNVEAIKELLRANEIPSSEWKLIIFYRCIILCEFNKNMSTFLSLIGMECDEPFCELMRSVVPIMFVNFKRDYFNRILDSTATPSAFRQPFDLQIDRILSMDSFSFYDSVLFQAHQVLLHTDSSRLRTPWSLGRGLRTETPFIIKLHDEPVEGDEGPFRAFFGQLVDELQHNIAADINYCAQNEDGTPMTLALLVPTPNRASDLGENREYFMFNPNLLYYLQSQSFYCLGRIIGISIRCCVPLHFDLPIWLWMLIKKQCGDNAYDVDDIDIDTHMAYLREFDMTSYQSLMTIRRSTCDDYPQLIQMFNVDATQYPFCNRASLVRHLLSNQLYGRFEGQIHALVEGISQIVPPNALNLFSEDELRLAICGKAKINLLLLKDHTVYRDGLSANHELILKFWTVIETLQDELKPKFVDFIYAQKRLPSKHEFTRKNLRLQISLLNVANPDQTLPQSQTCFLNLQIPQYTTKESLKRNFIKALTIGSGFYKESSE